MLIQLYLGNNNSKIKFNIKFQKLAPKNEKFNSILTNLKISQFERKIIFPIKINQIYSNLKSVGKNGKQ